MLVSFIFLTQFHLLLCEVVQFFGYVLQLIECQRAHVKKVHEFLCVLWTTHILYVLCSYYVASVVSRHIAIWR